MIGGGRRLHNRIDSIITADGRRWTQIREREGLSLRPTQVAKQ